MRLAYHISDNMDKIRHVYDYISFISPISDISMYVVYYLW